MKTLLLTLLLAAATLAADAQTTTNLVFRVTVETVTGGVTNSVNSTLRLDNSNESEAFAIAGFADAYSANVALNGGAAPSFQVFLRQELRDQFVRPVSRTAQDKAKQALAVDKIPTIIATQWENLTPQQRNQLAAIAAAFPNP